MVNMFILGRNFKEPKAYKTTLQPHLFYSTSMQKSAKKHT